MSVRASFAYLQHHNGA